MPELPDVELYLEHLDRRLTGAELEKVRLGNPFLLRSVDPPLSACGGKKVLGFKRIGKRIVFELEDELCLVLHLMIAGRLHFKTEKNAKLPGRRGQAAFDFDCGTLILTEAGTKRRASLHVARTSELATFDRGGLDVFSLDLAGFDEALKKENHTLKRALTDPRILSGIGNAYSDEILHRARLSPVKRTRQLGEEECVRLFEACRAVLEEWTDRLRAESGEKFPEKVTAFREEMAVHGKYRQPCPVCSAPVQRIIHGEHETNYCARCQTGGRVLKDRSLSKLLKEDWPSRIEELE